MRLDIESTGLLEPTLEGLKDDSIRYILHEGGTRSSKTYSILQSLILTALEKEVDIDICRRHLRVLRSTAMEDFENMLGDYDIYEEDNHNKSNSTYKLFDCHISFMGADQGKKLRGSKRDILYINEANEITKDAFRELRRRTRDTIILDLNPSHAPSHWIDNEVRGSGRTRVIKSTYLHNKGFLTEAQIKDIEADIPVYREEDGSIVKDRNLNYEGDGELIKGDPVEWAVHGLGIRASSPHIIYQKTTESPWPQGITPDAYGVDFGYTAPMALCAVAFTDQEGEDMNAHVDEVIYEKELTTADLIDRMDDKGIDKSTPIYCDSAEPDRIEEICRHGYNAQKAKKSVTAGIDKVKEHRLAFTPRSVNYKAEASRYRRQPGSDKPVKKDDHGMDSMRYAIFTHTTKPQKRVASASY